MTRPDLDAIRARCDAATPGPWRPDSEQGHGRGVRAIASVAWCPVACAVGKESQSIGRRDASRNAQFISHARTDIPALLAYIEKLESRTTYTVGETEWAMRVANAEERALTAEERLERVTRERDQERTVFEQENLALRRELARLMDDH